MNSRKTALAAALGLALMSGGAVAAHGGSASYVYGDVLSATPVYTNVQVPNDHRVCWNQQVQHTRYRNARGDTLLGTVIGGLVGTQFGKGGGRVAATVGGAIIGGSIANDYSHRHNPGQSYSTVEQRCEIRHEYTQEQRLTGYDVRYRYRGQVYNTRMQRDPGDQIRLRVSVSPAE